MAADVAHHHVSHLRTTARTCRFARRDAERTYDFTELQRPTLREIPCSILAGTRRSHRAAA